MPAVKQRQIYLCIASGTEETGDDQAKVKVLNPGVTALAAHVKECARKQTARFRGLSYLHRM